MTELPMLRVYPQRGEGDCAIASLAMYLGVSYEDALEAATFFTRRAHRRGLWSVEIMRAAEKLGTSLIRRRRFSFEHDAGILSGMVIDRRKRVGHAVVLRWGLIFEPDGGEVWEPEDYTNQKRAKWSELLTRER